MARHRSAIKRHRQSLKQRARNQAVRSRVRTEVKRVSELLAKRDLAGAEASLHQATRVVDKAVTKGVIHRSNASRKIARLASRLSRLRRAATV